MSPSPLLIQLPDPSLILLVGPSGAGKSTFAARHFRPTEIVSSDRCRAMISDDESDQTINAGAFALLHHIARARLSNRKLTVIDATNLQYQARRPFLRMARAHGFPVIALVFELSIESTLENNRRRPKRTVPEHIIAQHVQEMSGALSRLEHEGYEAIWRLDEVGVRAAVFERVSKLNQPGSVQKD